MVGTPTLNGETHMTTVAQNEAFTFDLAAEDGFDFDSSAIETVAYNREKKELFVSFASGGEYIYSDVEESTYLLFVQADSLGHFYQDYISGKFNSRKVYGALFERETESDEPTDDSAPEGRFSVEWKITDSIMGGKPEFQAVDESDALIQFWGEIDRVLSDDVEVKVLAVTHHFA
jgi:hypothetical protein